ncbi:MAG: acetyl-CoA carboxylase biotin carboxylase subunit [Cyclobacteriaceae bacterium]|nr:acetyl-CoA carboxylase biotin carboxylase subunit [Cyclobacteriaceae bacterium]
MGKIHKLLVANRGEIALRIMRSAKEMGIQTVAVYSEIDRNAMHVRFADEAYCIGPAPSSESYLRMDKIIEAAKKSGANAIHPGYGFLSENEDFADLVKESGLIFVGPSGDSMRTMGSKLAAKEAVSKFNVPLVPGTSTPITNVDEAKAIAKKIGYPILIKASAGGGGKGMRVVENETEFQNQMERAISEATASFGDGAVFIEKYIAKPRHIEFQVFGDQHGNVVHLFDRECSIQRRHQKVVEEAPSPVLTPELRKKMGEAAVNAAKAAKYYNAGTIEFILDEDMSFYFLEMNTRLQVEHPVTEMITGLDLVKLQIKIAEGEKLPFTQDQLTIHGHAIEVRVCAEDPTNNFLPDIGTLHTYRRPQGHGVRVDDGFEEGMTIPVQYDPLLAKLIVYAETRELAMDKMVRAIADYEITGVATTLGFGAFVMKHEAFRSGNFNTRFIENYFKPEYLQQEADEDLEKVVAALAVMVSAPANSTATAQVVARPVSKWKKNRV